MLMKPGARPHCGMNAVADAVGQRADHVGGVEVLGEVEIVGAPGRGLRDDGAEVEGQRVDDDVVPVDQTRRTLSTSSPIDRAAAVAEPRRDVGVEGAVGERRPRTAARPRRW